MLGGGGGGLTPRNFIGRLHADGSLDTTFDPGANDIVDALALQPDGKILVGGRFRMLGGGGTGTTTRNGIGRLHPDGSLDTTFNPDAIGASTSAGVSSLVLQPDGKILVGGWFESLGGAPRSNIGRLHPGGALDTTFNPGADSSVLTMALEPDGQIIVGGVFSALGGGGTGSTLRARIGRLHPDGTIDTTFDPGANEVVRAVAVQLDGKTLVGGQFTALGNGGTGSATRKGIGRLHPDGSLDANFNPGLNDPAVPGFPGTLRGTVFAAAVQSDGKILLGGTFTALGGGTGTTARNFIGRLYADGTVDADLNPGGNGGAYAIAAQPDGKIVVAGSFTSIGGGLGGTSPRSYIARLHPNGAVDATFDPGANSGFTGVAVQPDGKIVVAGNFTMLGGGGTGTTPRSYIGRLHPDGSLDTTFDPGANSYVSALAVQPDGKILVGGFFTMLGGGGTGTSPRSYIGRLHPDGSLDTTFDPGANSYVYALAVQPDGKILVGGAFTTLGGGGTGTSPRSSIGRLHADGSIDATFDPGANASVTALLVQPNGQIVVGGFFDRLSGGGSGTMPRSHIGRLHPEGALDTTFDPGANEVVFSLGMQTDAKILAAGWFTMLGGGGSGTVVRNRIARLNPDGALDPSFDPGAGGSVVALTMQSDGKVVIGGFFGSLGGGGFGTVMRHYMGRLTNTDAAIQRLSVFCPGCSPVGTVQTQVNWARSSAEPELGRVTFEASTDGVTYTQPTSATRVSGGWQAAIMGFTESNWYVRARGYYVSGFGNGSGSIVESIRQVYLACPAIVETSLPPGTAGSPYTATLTAAGALGVVTFGASGALPAGLALSSDGVLTGTPTQAGTFQLTVTATDQSSGCTGSQAVALPISPTTPLLTLDKTALRFAAVTTGAAFVSQTAAQIVRLTQSGAGMVTWTAVSSQPWLQVSPPSGIGSADLSISVVSVPGLPVGSPVAAAITLTVTGASNTPGPVAVSLDLLLNELSATPVGFVDTPLDNTTGVTGAIPFTGWALDDVEVTRVMVCRAAVGAEVAPVDPNCAGAQQIFVGSAVFIDGARPDVAAAYPTYPMHTRAGWGLMVLTNTLPGQGNGTYAFSMYAQDRDGHTTLLGTRTITCANATATKPFGAIDTPTQGGVASGNDYAVYGWVLSRLARADPPGGGTVTVQVNGVTVGSPGGWAARPDLTAVFPGYPGIDTALGIYGLNTLTYANGVHTISWTVTDSLGVAEGIGSRFFTVSNGTAAVTTAVEGAARAGTARTEDVASALQDDRPVLGRRGWDLAGPWRSYAVGRDGRAVVRGEEIDRFELWLGAQGGERYTGHLRMGDRLGALPAGSQLDAASGWFTWAPGVGFVGVYDLVFVRWVGDRAVTRRDVRVILHPKGSGATGPQVVIDIPRSSQEVVQPFALGGWAADLTATAGTGIAAVHAWAYPLAGGPPVFLGATSYGGARPDVAAVYGEPFRNSGFGLVVQGLTHGEYDLAVFAWSSEAADFVPAKVVRVTAR